MSSRLHLLRARDVQIYQVCEALTEPLIYLMVIFSPWSFGTTQPWAIATMNAAGYFLGALLLVKLFIRFFKNYRPSQWGQMEIAEHDTETRSRLFTAPHLANALALLTLLMLLYCLVSALNAAASYEREALGFVYHPYVQWLPHSFDSIRTWFWFWNYVALACTFWAVADWLPGQLPAEQRALRQKSSSGSGAAGPLFPARLRRLLWFLSINGALVGLEGIVQRLEGSGRLLFLIKPSINFDPLSQFGPYHYRANASAFFNLIWPVTLGLWWTLQRRAGFRQWRHHLLLLCALIMAACPIISSSRGGALITAAIIVLSAFFFVAAHFLLAAHRREDRRTASLTLGVLLLFFTGALVLGLSLGWKALKPRLADLREGFEEREQMYATARPMAHDYPLFGTGPGTFEPVFQLYRPSTETYWPAQLHDDWLETRITFGWVGLGLIILALSTVLLRWFVPGGLHGGRRFMILAWLSLGGCLVHARFDFPFQVYSLLFIFLVLCAVVFNLSRRP